tara:strand:- start:68994 stop:69782 length:789 start_codon:yes stop_codon:yes gene_type:complete
LNPFDTQAPVPGIKHILFVGSGKGGVGKSTVAANLALALKTKGCKVGLLDADIYGPSLPRMFGAINQNPEVNEDKKIFPIQRYGLKLMSIGFLVAEESSVIWRGPMLFKAMDQFFRDVIWGELDYLVIDLPPGTGDIPLTLAQKVPISGAVTVTTPQNLSLIDAKKALDMWERINVPNLGVVENMAGFVIPGQDEPLAMFPKGELDGYLDQKGLTKMASIPFHPTIAMSSEAGIPFMESQSDSNESQAYTQMANIVLERLKI